MPPFTYSLLSTLPDLLLLFYSFTLRFPRRFLLSSFFGTVSPAVELLRERREKVIRCSSYDRRRWGMKYVPGSYISPNFAEYALQSRMKRYVEIGALCCASCRSFKKKKFREKGRRTHMIAACALYEYVIRRILCIIRAKLYIYIYNLSITYYYYFRISRLLSLLLLFLLTCFEMKLEINNFYIAFYHRIQNFRKKKRVYKSLQRINGTVISISSFGVFYVGNKNFRGHGQPYVRSGCRSLGEPRERGRPTSDG